MPTSALAAASSSANMRGTTRSLAAALLCVAAPDIALAQIGTSYCVAVPNSTGAAATISGSGSTSVVLNDLRLSGTHLPLHSAAYFLCSRTQGFVPTPFGSFGNICLGNPIGRLVGGLVLNSGPTGAVSVLVDVHAMPQPAGAVVVQAGETWNFQCWHRDQVLGQATSNFSDGLAVLFTGGGGNNPIPGLVPIPAGTFLMGSNAPAGPPYYPFFAEQPVHQVTISYPFWMGQYEVTQPEYQQVTGTNPSHFPGSTRPVDRVQWWEARAYCAALTAQYAGSLPVGYEVRLPTEAEWEYACRAGTTTEFHYGPALFCNQAWFLSSDHVTPQTTCGNPSGTTPVGSFAPNGFGLYDMHGNVWEWCLDSLAPYSAAAVTDPFVTGSQSKLLRGGGWVTFSSGCRAAFRYAFDNGVTDNFVGFRIVLAPVRVP